MIHYESTIFFNPLQIVISNQCPLCISCIICLARYIHTQHTLLEWAVNIFQSAVQLLPTVQLWFIFINFYFHFSCKKNLDWATNSIQKWITSSSMTWLPLLSVLSQALQVCYTLLLCTNRHKQTVWNLYDETAKLNSIMGISNSSIDSS